MHIPPTFFLWFRQKNEKIDIFATLYFFYNKETNHMWNTTSLKKTFKLAKLFRELNGKYFRNKLGECKFEVSPDPCDNLTAAAAIEYRDKRNGNKAATIIFNSRIDWDEKSIRQVLLHELIHFYVFVKIGHCPCFQHGLPFIFKMITINILHNEHIHMCWPGEKITWSDERKQ